MVIDGVEALNGILLPSALIFLVLLANDKPVLGPWTNSTAQNWVSGLIVWTVTTFSLAPLVTTFFPNVTLRQCVYAFGVCTVLGLVVGLVLWRRRPSRGTLPALAPDSNRRPPGMNRAEWRALLWERRSRGAPRAWTRWNGLPSACRAGWDCLPSAATSCSRSSSS